MYVEDQDEEVEEEEEFHEVEEEKHRTSQESVGCSGDKTTESPNRSSRKQEQPPSKKLEEPATNIQIDQSISRQENLLVVDAGADQVAKDESKAVSLGGSISDSEGQYHPSQAMESRPSSDSAASAEELSDRKVAVEKHHANASAEELIKVHTDLVTSPLMAQSEFNDDRISAEHSPMEKSVRGIDWANIMLNNSTVNENDKATGKSIVNEARSTLDDEAQSDKKADDTIDDIVEETQKKLRITDEKDVLQQEQNDSTLNDDDIHVLISVQHKGSTNADASDISPKHGENSQQNENKADEEVHNDSGQKVDESEKKVLDLDEDVKNPQYIPKKGVFYEHDDRSHDTEDKKSSPSNAKKEDETFEVKNTSANKKNSGGEKQAENRRSNRRQRTDADRWNHDLFRNEKQKPKSKSELINAYGYDIRQERSSRNQSDTRNPRNNNSERHQGPQDSQRSRQSKDSRNPRQGQTNNRSRERRPRRQNVRGGRSEGSQSSVNRRDGQLSGKSIKNDGRDLRETLNEKHALQEAAATAAAAATATNVCREQGTQNPARIIRNDSRGRRRTSRDRPSNDEPRLPPANTIMPPITTWSSEDMMKAEAFGKKSPPNMTLAAPVANTNTISNSSKDRSADYWQQGQPNKNIYQERSNRNQEDVRQHHQYNSRGRYQDRGDENIRTSQFVSRNQFNDRSNQHHEWNRSSNFSPYTKPNDYIVKTQTFENSRLSQANTNRSNNSRDLRDVIDRRMHNHQNYSSKSQQNADHHVNQRSLGQYHHPFSQSQHYMHAHQQQVAQDQSLVLQQHPQLHSMAHNSQHQTTHRPPQPSPQQSQSVATQAQPQSQHTVSKAQQARQPVPAQSEQPQQNQRQNLALNTAVDSNQDVSRIGPANNNDLINSRPIIKTDSYNGPAMPTHQHSQPLSQHSQNHRSMGGAMAQQGPTASSHIVSTHIGTTQPQYYTPSASSRDVAAALATAYHGYMPGGHSVMDPSRYHMTTQQLPDHGYLTATGQTNDVANSVLHQQGLYTDTSAGGTMASSAYMAPSGSTLSPTSNIPVTGAGAQPLPPVSYIQHSQYPPPPYTNPYTPPQHNQAPPPAGHAYPPYWAYI